MSFLTLKTCTVRLTIQLTLLSLGFLATILDLSLIKLCYITYLIIFITENITDEFIEAAPGC